MSNPYTINIPGAYTLDLSRADAAPKLGEVTAAQPLPPDKSKPSDVAAMVNGGYASSGDQAGFKAPKPGDYAVYREIASHPTVALTLAKIIGPVRSNTWTWKEKEGKSPKGAMDALKEHFDLHRAQIIFDAIGTALPLGWAPFEKVYAEVDGGLILPTLKPLLVDYTEYLKKKKTGELLGLKNKPRGESIGNDDKGIELPWNKAFAFSLDGEAGNPYGKSRLEDLRKSGVASEAVQIRDRLAKYMKKIAAIIPQIFYPEGTSKNAAGAEFPNQYIAMQLMKDVQEGKAIALLNKFASFLSSEGGSVTPAMLEKALASAGKSDWLIDFLDPGGTDYAPGFKDTLEYYDKLLVRGCRQPERAVLEATQGGRADAEQFADTAIVDSEQLDRDFALAFNRDVLDDCLEYNYGKQYRGTVYVEASPIADTTGQTGKEMIVAALASPLLAVPLANKIDWIKAATAANIPLQDETAAIVFEMPKPPAPAGGDKPTDKPRPDAKKDAAQVLSMAVDLLAGDAEAA